MKKAIPLSLFLLLITQTLAPAATRQVPEQCATIQQAIDDANDGDTVIVSPGTYAENINFNGKNIIVRGIDPNDPETVAATVIAKKTSIGGPAEGSVVTFANGEGPGAMLSGFTITGGYGTADTSISEANYIFWGAGIFCKNASPTITCNVITGNNGPHEMEGDNSEQWQLGYGGGIGCIGSSAIIIRNIIKNNSAYAGAGIMTSGKDIKISNNLIYYNSAFIGGGVVLLGGRLFNNTIVSNDASLGDETGMGGNVYAVCDPDFDQTSILNNIIYNAKSGGGVFLQGNCGDSSFAFNNVWGNLPGNYGGIDPNTNEFTYDLSLIHISEPTRPY